MSTGAWILLEPKASFEVASGIEVTVFRVSASVAPKDTVAQPKAKMHRVAHPTQPA